MQPIPQQTNTVLISAKRYWPAAVGVVAVLLALAYGASVNSRAREAASNQQAINATVSQLRAQLQETTEQMNTLKAERAKRSPFAEPIVVAQPDAPAQQPSVTDEPKPRVAPPSKARKAKPVSAVAVNRRPVDDPRWNKVESQLNDQAEKIASTQQDIERNRQLLEGKLDSTKDELNGSIARTHAEVVELQKRGERDYQEFQLAKSKEFRRVGGVSIALRKADTKHKRYDVEVIVDDVKLQKKNVNLFEPVYFTVTDRPQPLELVVNQISKDQVTGYVSMPKYKKSELAQR